jgi:hypothetical protein
MLDLKSLHFRVLRSEWEGYVYFFEIPGQAYASREEAESGLPEDHVVVDWEDMSSRVYRDIHADA